MSGMCSGQVVLPLDGSCVDFCGQKMDYYSSETTPRNGNVFMYPSLDSTESLQHFIYNWIVNIK